MFLFPGNVLSLCKVNNTSLLITLKQKKDKLYFLVHVNKCQGLESPLWVGGLRTQHSVCEDAGSTLGPAPWVKDLVLSQTEHRSQMWLGYGIAVAVV